MTDELQRRLLESQAEGTLTHFSRHYPYPGRIIVVGLSEDGTKIHILYGLTGRSESTRNRILVAKECGILSTEFADPSKATGDPELLLYDAMMESLEDTQCIYVATNGRQTEELLDNGPVDEDFLGGWSYEPDSNSTPRINAFVGIKLDDHLWYFGFSIFRKSLFNDSTEYKLHFYEEMEPGFGYGISTYRPPLRELIPEAYGEENPLTSFWGDPYMFPMKGTPEEVMRSFHRAFDGENFISLAMKTIAVNTGESEMRVINKYA